MSKINTLLFYFLCITYWNILYFSKCDPNGDNKDEMKSFGNFVEKSKFSLPADIKGDNIDFYRNVNRLLLYSHAIKESKALKSISGALCCYSGEKTGRSPLDKRIVEEESSKDKIWWGDINIKLDEDIFEQNRQTAINCLSSKGRIYIVDAYAGWNKDFRIKVRVITSQPYHALFMQNMLVLPSKEELNDFEPELIIYDAGVCKANTSFKGITSTTSVAIHFGKNQMVILGTEYAGEIKKAIFTLFMYKMPLVNNLPLHSSCNVGKNGDVSLFFGLSGTGKTTLSADSSRELIGDDEHVWTEKGIFNIEGGCYAKCINLSRVNEPEIFNAIKFGAVLENVVVNNVSGAVDYSDASITDNTRVSYPLSFLPNSYTPAYINKHPSNIILLTFDAFGVLPPISMLSIPQAVYYFMSGYTSKMSGTEQGVTTPTATFSPCYAAPFLPLHPYTYAKLLAEKLEKHKDIQVWHINTGWIGGGQESAKGHRISLRYTRMMIDAIHQGTINYNEFYTLNVFKLKVPRFIPGIPEEIFNPEVLWKKNDENNSIENYEKQLLKLANLFISNFKQYDGVVPFDIIQAGPTVN